jgi:hypothetical protein
MAFNGKVCSKKIALRGAASQGMVHRLCFTARTKLFI